MTKTRRYLETALYYDPVRFVFILKVSRCRTVNRGPFWPFLFPKTTRETRHYFFYEGTPTIINAETMKAVKWPQIRYLQNLIRVEFKKARAAGPTEHARQYGTPCWPDAYLPAANAEHYEFGYYNRLPRMLNPPAPPAQTKIDFTPDLLRR